MQFGIYGDLPMGKVIKIGDGHYLVPSRKRPHISHMVDVEGRGDKCRCEDAIENRNKSCFHIRYVMALKQAGVIQ